MTQLDLSESPEVAADAELLCPLCDYNLHGLIDPRCPECGYTFEWDDLRDPARRKHRYLFEHHPERNVRSYLRTMIGGLRPRRFWTGLLPSQPSRPRRLAIYAVAIFIGALVPMFLYAVREVAHSWAEVAAMRRQWTVYLATAPGLAKAQSTYPGLTTAQILDQVAPRPSPVFLFQQRHFQTVMGYVAIVEAVPVLWVAFTLASLTLLQVSLHNARKRQIHLVRCVIYCADIFLWGQLLATAAMLLFTLKALTAGSRIGHAWWNDDEVMVGTFAWAVLGLLPVFCYRLITAFRKYLQFAHPISTILLTQFLVSLAVLVVLVFVVAG